MSVNKKGNTCFFGGLRPRPSTLDKQLFKEIFDLSWNPQVKLHLPPFWNNVKREIKDIIDKVDPDIIHAHDVFAGKMSKEIGIPYVYDSHEFWNKDMPLKLVKRGLQVLSLKHLIARTFGVGMWDNWQKEIVSDGITLTVSQRIVETLREINENVFLLPNFPFKSEVEKISFQGKDDDFWSAYVGNDLTAPAKHRDVAYLSDIFSLPGTGNLAIIGDRKLESTERIQSVGFLPYHEMLNRLTRYHVGLLTWAPHPYHKFCLPNKIADYAHAGLPIVLMSSLESAMEILGDYCVVIKEPSGMDSKLRDLMQKKNEIENMSEEIVDFARRELVWERYEDNIFNAYKMALDMDTG